jgi:hypothetical protein
MNVAIAHRTFSIKNAQEKVTNLRLGNNRMYSKIIEIRIRVLLAVHVYIPTSRPCPKRLADSKNNHIEMAHLR